MIENGTLLQDRYLIEQQIGAGGMGAVYRAVDRRFDNYVAIKETFYTDDELGTAFEREARLLNSLQHPALPHVSDYFAENNGYFLVMQFIEGEDMSDVLKRDGARPVADVIRWTNNLLDALDYLHSQDPPIIHRDIKPHNLKLTARGDIILLDFGLAKLNSGETTGAVSVFGYSRVYSPLEQIQGTGTDARSDIFSLGATVYHLLTGKPAIDALARASSIVGGKSDPLRLANEIKEDVPIGIATVIHSALALNPDQRFASAKAMRQALEHAVKEIADETIEVAAPENAAFAFATHENEAPLAPVAPPIVSAEVENFPALEAFAETVNAAEHDATQNFPITEVAPPIVSPVVSPVIPAHASEPQRVSPVTEVIELPTQVSPVVRRKKSFLPVAAAAAALLGGILTIFYFTAGANTPSEAEQMPVAQTVSASEVEKDEKPVAETVSSKQPVETVSQAKPKAPVAEANVQKRDSDVEDEQASEEPETKGNSNRAASLEEVAKPAPAVKTPRRPQQSRQQETEVSERRSRVVEDEPVSDIESIFTGQSTGEDAPRQGRRNRANPRTEEEREQLRRERRERRRERRNEQTLPPF